MKTAKASMVKHRFCWRSFFSLICLFMAMQAFGQNVSTVLIESWENNDWANLSRTTNTYDGSGHLTVSTSQFWDESSSTWVNSMRSNYTNNPNGTVNQVVSQMWNPIISNWDNSYRISYTYNASQKVLTSTTENWTAVLSSWTPTVKNTYAYDGSGYLVNFLLQVWDFIGSTWQNNLQSTYTNNANGTVSVEIQQTWNAGSSSWVNSSRTTYTYNAAAKPTVVVTENWSGTDWVIESRVTYDYDASSYLIHSLSQDWDVGSSTYVSSNQEFYTNNANGTVNQIVSQDWTNNAWVNSTRLTFTYVPLAVAQFQHGVVTAYPNPVQDVVNIKANAFLADRNYTISDLTGKTFLKGQLADEDMAINVNTLAAGIYFVRIGNQQPIKVIKE